MKIEVEKIKFKPITITLETEDELYQMYAASNYTEIGEALPLFFDIFKEFQESFGDYKLDGSQEYLDKLHNHLINQ
jgi:hypothetical protein